MSNMHDVIEIRERTTEKPLTKKLSEVLETRGMVQDILQRLGVGDQPLHKNDVLIQGLQKLEVELEAARAKSFLANGGDLPHAIEETIALTESRRKETLVNLFFSDVLTHASRAPKGTLPDLRAVADKMGFILAPMDVVKDAVLAAATTKKGDPAKAFADLFRNDFDSTSWDRSGSTT